MECHGAVNASLALRSGQQRAGQPFRGGRVVGGQKPRGRQHVAPVDDDGGVAQHARGTPAVGGDPRDHLVHRGRVRVPADAEEAAIRQAALADPHVMKFIGGEAAVKRVIVVPGRQIVNIVVAAASAGVP